MFKKLFVFFLAVFCLTGCTKCIITLSEYYDITGKVFLPKADDAPIDILTTAPSRPTQEVGVVKVLARWGTPKATINKEMEKRARAAGADAVVDVQYGEDTSNKLILCGKLVATKRNLSASGKAVIYTDKK
jgi:hypothetical protein